MKIIKINACNNCPERIMINCKNYCKKVRIKDRRRRIRFVNEIPKWCPLEDYNVNNNR